MIALIQRVKEAAVCVEGKTVGEIGQGLLILLGVHIDDTVQEMEWVARKCAQLRIFQDAEGRMNLSVKDVGGEILVVSQFTLYGNTRKGNRPSFVESALPAKAEPLYEQFVTEISGLTGQPAATGVFGAMMDVRLVNDGPVTLSVEKKAPASEK